MYWVEQAAVYNFYRLRESFCPTGAVPDRSWGRMAFRKALLTSSDPSIQSWLTVLTRGIWVLKSRLVNARSCLVIGAICHRLGPLSYNRRPEDQKRGIRWTPFSALEDLNFAYDLALLSHTLLHMQEKTDRLCMFSTQVGLTIRLNKTEAMYVNASSPAKIKVRGQDILYTDKFTYLGGLLCQEGGTMWTCKTGWIQQALPWWAQDQCRGQQATALRRRLRSTKVACCPPYLMALNVSEKPSMTF